MSPKEWAFLWACLVESHRTPAFVVVHSHTSPSPQRSPWSNVKHENVPKAPVPQDRMAKSAPPVASHGNTHCSPPGNWAMFRCTCDAGTQETLGFGSSVIWRCARRRWRPLVVTILAPRCHRGCLKMTGMAKKANRGRTKICGPGLQTTTTRQERR